MQNKRLVAFGIVALISACEQAPESLSTVNSLAADTGAKNYAVVITGSTDGIPGVRKDPGNLQQVFGDQSLGLNFILQGDTSEMKTPAAPGDTIFKEVGTAEIIRASGEIAKRMLDDEKATGKKGTMFWYLSSHGAEDGSLISADGSFYFKEVAKAIRENRGGVPLRRLVVFIDVCYSGQTIEGSQKINKQSGLGLTGGGDDSIPASVGAAILSQFGGDDLNLAEDPVDTNAKLLAKLEAVCEKKQLSYRDCANLKNSSMSAAGAMTVNAGGLGLLAQGDLYEELFAGAASNASQTSGDAPDGGAGTTSYRNAFKSLAQTQRQSAKFSDLAAQTLAGVQGQTPVFNYDPPGLANELLFVSNNPSGPVSPAGPQGPSRPDPNVVVPPGQNGGQPASPPPVQPQQVSPPPVSPSNPQNANGDLIQQLINMLSGGGNNGGSTGP